MKKRTIITFTGDGIDIIVLGPMSDFVSRTKVIRLILSEKAFENE
jgi:hypothetical protein